MARDMHPARAAWIGDPETDRALSFDVDLQAMLRFWIALAAEQAALGLIPQEAASTIAARAPSFRPDTDGLRDGTLRDGILLPDLLRQLRAAMGDAGAHLHLGATSQDVMDTSLMLRLAGLTESYLVRADALLARLDALGTEYGDRRMMGVTRLRDALPITVGDRIGNWAGGLRAARAELAARRKTELAVQYAGPVGTLGGLDGHGPELRARLAGRLNLADPGGSWHSDRARVVRIGAALAELARALGKIGADIGHMAQDGVGAARIAGGGSSSMAHKVNPVDAELLVALAAYAGAALGTLAQGVHASERDGTVWTLEMLVLPDLLGAAGGALGATERLLSAIRELG